MPPSGLQIVFTLMTQTNEPPAAADRATTILLPQIMDHLLLVDILRAMAVSRLWHDHAINHYTYYGKLYLRESDPPGWLSLFRTRLLRSAGRPISVRAELGDSGILMQEIASHLFHIHSLALFQSESHDFLPVLNALCGPANMLRSLSLHYSPGPQQPAVSLPPNFLGRHAPVLERVHLSDIAFRSGIPESFYNIRQLSFGTTLLSSELPLVLPEPFRLCPKLRVLHLLNDVSLGPEACLAQNTWEHMSEVIFSGQSVAVEWPAFRLPLTAVTKITSVFGDTDSALALAETLPGNLEVTFPPLIRELAPAPFEDTAFKIYTAVLRCISPPGHRVRQLEGQVSISGNGCLAAFRVPALIDRIVRLVLALTVWEEFVSLGVFGPFTALDELVLTLNINVEFTNAAPSKMSCPSLRRLVLSGQHRNVDLGALTDFALAALPGARFPLRLKLEGINFKLTGTPRDSGGPDSRRAFIIEHQ